MNLNGKNNFLESAETKIEKFIGLFLPKKSAKISVQFCKCAIVGASNTLVDLAVLNLLMFFTGINTGIYISLFSGISFIAADVNSFLWNKFWTFRDKKKDSRSLLRQIIAFLIVSSVGLAINTFAVHIIVNVIEKPQWAISASLWANIAKLCAVFLTIAWNFTGYKLIVFK